jgi:hypothetical protein
MEKMESFLSLSRVAKNRVEMTSDLVLNSMLLAVFHIIVHWYED